MAHQDWDYKKDVIENNFEMATGKQILYIDELRESLGKPCDDKPWLLSRKAAAALIHDLHLEWLRERGDAK